MARLLFLFILVSVVSSQARADDWPQFRGPNRDGAWNETGIMETFPREGLKIAWRATVGHGLSSPVVAHGRVYLVDSELKKPEARECVRCFDGKTGSPAWTRTFEVTYPDWAFDPTQDTGPNATPVIQDGKIWVLGRTGNLACLDAATGAVAWQRDLGKEAGVIDFPGNTPSPLIEGNLLILLPGIQPGGCAMAFDKDTGKDAWRALEDPWTYSSPLVISAGGKRQLVIWTPKSVTSLDPATGKPWWREPVDTTNHYGVAPAVWDGDRLLFSGLMFHLDPARPAATVAWPENRSPAKVVLSSCSIPVIQGIHVYSGKTSGQLACLDAATGKQVWETDKVTGRANGATIHLTPNGGTFLIFTDQGNLIRARLSPEGYTELSRAHVVEPTYSFGGHKLVWPPPAYADARIFVHNQTELVCASLAQEP